MIVASWNVNSVRVRYPHIEKLWSVKKPNVIALQETKVSDVEFPHSLLEQTHPYHYIVGDKGRNGVAILSDVEASFVQKDLPMTGHQKGRMIHAVIQGVHIINVYVPNGESLQSDKFLYKEKFFYDLRQYIEPLLHEPLLLMGDFNVARRPCDTYAPKRFANQLLFSPQERRWYRALTQEMMDIADIAWGGRATSERYTWWDYRSASFPDKGLRIDAIFASIGVVPCVVDQGVLQFFRQEERPSDHVPVWCVLEKMS